jgi:hypothetical protein
MVLIGQLNFRLRAQQGTLQVQNQLLALQYSSLLLISRLELSLVGSIYNTVCTNNSPSHLFRLVHELAYLCDFMPAPLSDHYK